MTTDGEFRDAATNLVDVLSRIGYYYRNDRKFVDSRAIKGVEAAFRAALGEFGIESNSICIDSESLFVCAFHDEFHFNCSCGVPRPANVKVEFKRGYYLDFDEGFFVSLLFDRITFCPVDAFHPDEIVSGGRRRAEQLLDDVTKILKYLVTWVGDIEARFEVGLVEAYRPLP